MGRPRKKPDTPWAFGDKSKVANLAGVSVTHFVNVLNRRAAMTREKARMVAAAARSMGYALDWRDLVRPYASTNPLLRKKEK